MGLSNQKTRKFFLFDLLNIYAPPPKKLAQFFTIKQTQKIEGGEMGNCMRSQRDKAVPPRHSSNAAQHSVCPDTPPPQYSTTPSAPPIQYAAPPMYPVSAAVPIPAASFNQQGFVQPAMMPAPPQQPPQKPNTKKHKKRRKNSRRRRHRPPFDHPVFDSSSSDFSSSDSEVITTNRTNTKVFSTKRTFVKGNSYKIEAGPGIIINM